MSTLFFNKKSDDFPKRLKELVLLAKKADKWCKVFGSETHKYKFNPVVSLAEVREFEDKNKITLPDDFVTFLTEVGNGGAGVDYGVYTLKKIQHEIDAHLPESDKTILDYDNYKEKWAELCREYENADDDKILDRIYSILTDGLLAIGTAGCTVDYVIVCKGNYYGKIACIDYNFFEDSPPEIIANSFSEWIENYFTKIINGDLIKCGSFKKIIRK